MGPLVRWEPTRALSRLREDMNRLMEDFFGETLETPAFTEGLLMPTVDVIDRPHEILVRAEIPGVEKDQLKVNAAPESVTLDATIRKEHEEKGESFIRRERRIGSFHRVIPLPAEVKPNEVKATYRDGVLEVTLPKTETAKTQAVQVTID